MSIYGYDPEEDLLESDELSAPPSRDVASVPVDAIPEENKNYLNQYLEAKNAASDQSSVAGYGSAFDKIISSIAGTKAQPDVYESMKKGAADESGQVLNYLKSKFEMDKAEERQKSLDKYRNESLLFNREKLKSLQDYGREKLKQNQEKIRKDSMKGRGNSSNYSSGGNRGPQGDEYGGSWESSNSSFERNPPDTWDLKAVERYQSRLAAETKHLKEVAASASNVERFAEMAKTNPLMSAVVPNTLARAVGEKGPLSNFDLTLWGGSQAVIDRLRRAAKKAMSGTLPEEDIKFIKEVGSALTAAAASRLESVESDWVDKYTSNYGGRKDFNYSLITGRERAKSNVNKLPPAANTGQVRKFYSPSTNKTKVIYPDGREEILDGRQ